LIDEAVSKVVLSEEGEEGIVDTSASDPEGQAATGPVDSTGIKAAAAQAVGALNELVKQCSAVGMSGTDYEDMASDIQMAFDLPGGTTDVVS
jgi:hypothetical protein